jgi:hypothetical protein
MGATDRRGLPSPSARSCCCSCCTPACCCCMLALVLTALLARVPLLRRLKA